MITPGVDIDLPEELAAVNAPAQPKPRQNSPEFEQADLRVNLSEETRKRGLSHLAAMREKLAGDPCKPEPAQPETRQSSLSGKLDLLGKIQNQDVVQRVARKVAA